MKNILKKALFLVVTVVGLVRSSQLDTNPTLIVSTISSIGLVPMEGEATPFFHSDVQTYPDVIEKKEESKTRRRVSIIDFKETLKIVTQDNEPNVIEEQSVLEEEETIDVKELLTAAIKILSTAGLLIFKFQNVFNAFDEVVLRQPNNVALPSEKVKLTPITVKDKKEDSFRLFKSYFKSHRSLLASGDIDVLKKIATMLEEKGKVEECGKLKELLSTYEELITCPISYNRLDDGSKMEPSLLVKKYKKEGEEVEKIVEVPKGFSSNHRVYEQQTLKKIKENQDSRHPFTNDKLTEPEPYKEGDITYPTHYTIVNLATEMRDGKRYVNYRPLTDLANTLRSYINKYSKKLKMAEKNETEIKMK